MSEPRPLMPRRDPEETPADRKLRRARDKAGKQIKWGLITGVALAALVAYTLGFHTVTKADTCAAFNKSIAVNIKFMRHLEVKSIENVEAGNTSSTTTIPEIRRFFNPTIRELHNTHC